MQVYFIGPIGRVTGSCTWLYEPHTERQLLVDCGTIQGGEASAKGSQDWNAGHFPFDPQLIDHVLLTHAHLDHCGLLPLLVKRGYSGVVLCSRETQALAKIVLMDAANHTDAYDQHDVAAIRWAAPGGDPQRETFGWRHRFGDDLFAWFHRSSHLLGACTIRIAWGTHGVDQRVMQFSGDVGPSHKHRLRSFMLDYNMGVWPANYLLLESTYGGERRDQGPAEPTVGELDPLEVRLELLRTLVQKVASGACQTLLLPAFALGRSQEILLDLHLLQGRGPELFADIDVWLDSTMAQRASQAHAELVPRLEDTFGKGPRPRWLARRLFETLGLDRKNPTDMKRCGALLAAAWIDHTEVAAAARTGDAVSHGWRPMTRYITSAAQRSEARAGRGVVVASGGMCSGGPVVEWLHHLLGRSDAHIALTGYCAAGTPGAELLAVARHRQGPQSGELGPTVQLPWQVTYGEPPQLEVWTAAEIRAEITTMNGYSAHADVPALLDTVFPIDHGVRKRMADVVFLNHGTQGARNGMQRAIEDAATRYGACAETAELADVTVIQPTARTGWYDLDEGRWLGADAGPAASLEDRIHRMEAELQALRQRQRLRS